MAVSIEDILLARAQQDQQQGMTGALNTLGGAMPTAGAIGGGVVGAALGEADLLRRLKTRTAPTSLGQSVRRAVTPGPRMAGGLVGAILGGALGEGSKQMMIQQSPAAAMLAKLQTQGDLSPQDQNALQTILADTYSTIVR